MRRRLVSLLLLALLAGCGGDEEPELYALDPTRACLADDGVRVGANRDDFVASTAFGGSMRARFRSDNVAVLSFGESIEDAARIEQAYGTFAPERVRLENVLGRFRNVVTLWSFSPSQEDLRTVSDCLKG